MISDMDELRQMSTEWSLVRGRRRRWLRRFLILPAVLLFIFRVMQWIWYGWDWDVAVGLLVPVSLGLLLLTQLRPRTRAIDEGLLVRGEFAREKLIHWHDVQGLAADGGRWATAVTAQLTDGRSVKLSGVAPEDLDSVKAATDRAQRGYHD